MLDTLIGSLALSAQIKLPQVSRQFVEAELGLADPELLDEIGPLGDQGQIVNVPRAKYRISDCKPLAHRVRSSKRRIIYSQRYPPQLYFHFHIIDFKSTIVKSANFKMLVD